MSEHEEKTEQPSEFKLLEARKKGRVAKSADVAALLSFFFAIFFLATLLPLHFNKFITFFVSLHGRDYQKINTAIIYNSLDNAFTMWFFLSCPVLVIASLGAIFGNIGQFGFLLSTQTLKPDIKKINPVTGFKKLFSKDRAVELIKQLVKFVSVFLIIYYTVRSSLSQVSMLFRVQLSSALHIAYDLIVVVIVRVLLCFFAIAIFDFFWQRYSFMKSMRMSKYEVKKEYKQQEGDPHIKQERKRIQQETIEAASSNNIHDASVVITNPSHLAVALRYDENIDCVPTLLAKGAGHTAKTIIYEARYHSIPVIRNVPLARDLQWLQINEEIPKNLYDSVAEVLIFVNQLQHRESEKQC